MKVPVTGVPAQFGTRAVLPLRQCVAVARWQSGAGVVADGAAPPLTGSCFVAVVLVLVWEVSDDEAVARGPGEVAPGQIQQG